MIIHLKKFGAVLVSRPAGKEAWLAFQPVLNSVGKNEKIAVDFSAVAVFTPSWADEFLTPLRARFGSRVTLRPTDNPSVKATFKILTQK